MKVLVVWKASCHWNRFYLPAHLLDIFHELKHKWHRIHRKLVGLIEFLKALLELWPVAERDVLQWTSGKWKIFFCRPHCHWISEKDVATKLDLKAYNGHKWNLGETSRHRLKNQGWHSHSWNRVFEDWGDFFLGVKVKRWNWGILISKESAHFWVHDTFIFFVGIHQPDVLFLQEYSWDRIMKSRNISGRSWWIKY